MIAEEDGHQPNDGFLELTPGLQLGRPLWRGKPRLEIKRFGYPDR